MFSRKAQMKVDKEHALPGRAQPLSVANRHFVLGRPIKPPFPAGYKAVQFGMGCFWGAERVFWTLDGVYTTAVGYAGGYTENATYEEVCSGFTGHAEVVLVVYDPAVAPFAKLLEVFWQSHDPTQGMRQGADIGTQYRSAIYCSDADRARAGRAEPRALSDTVDRAPLPEDHDRDRRSSAVLLRRGLPPAVPCEKSRRLLRARRLRRRVQRGPHGDVTPLNPHSSRRSVPTMT